MFSLALHLPMHWIVLLSMPVAQYLHVLVATFLRSPWISLPQVAVVVAVVVASTLFVVDAVAIAAVAVSSEWWIVVAFVVDA